MVLFFLVLGRFIFCCWNFEAFFKKILPSMNFLKYVIFLGYAQHRNHPSIFRLILSHCQPVRLLKFLVDNSPFKGMLRSTRSMPWRWVPSCCDSNINTYPNQPTNQPTAGSRKGQNRVVSISRLELLQTASWWAKGKGTAMIGVDPKNILNVGWLEVLESFWQR